MNPTDLRENRRREWIEAERALAEATSPTEIAELASRVRVLHAQYLRAEEAQALERRTVPNKPRRP